MVFRVYGSDFILLHDTPDEVSGFDSDAFGVDSKNVVLSDGRNFGVFEYLNSDERIGHVFLKDRGRKGLLACKAFLEEVFTVYNVKAVIGLVPNDRKDVKVFVSVLGFTRAPDVFPGFSTYSLLQKDFK